jgi:hypothetical protein
MVILKIQQALDQNLQPVVSVVHVTPEQALDNIVKRFKKIGRGASINLMADIQGGLPGGIAEIHKHFGHDVKLVVYDYTDKRNEEQKNGWEYISILQKEGNYEQIKQRLINAVEQHRANGTISDDCYQQAYGKIPRNFSRIESMGRTNNKKYEESKDRQGIQREDRGQNLLTLETLQKIDRNDFIKIIESEKALIPHGDTLEG